MKSFWNWLDNKEWKATTKFKTALLILCIAAGCIGLCAWLIIRQAALSSIGYMFMFLGYPVVLAWLYTVLHAYRHDLHNGSAEITESDKRVQHTTAFRPGHAN